MLAVVVWAVACLLTRWMLLSNRYAPAVWTYALGGVAAGTIILIGGDTVATQIIPFVFPLIIFVVGLLLPPISTLVMATLASGAVLIMPLVNGNVGGWGIHQVFAVMLTYASAVLAAQ